MWLKLEFPLAGEAEKQENRGRGEKKRDSSGSRFTQARGLLAHPCVRLSPLHTHTHTQIARPRQQIPLNSYKVRLQHGCTPGPCVKSVPAWL